MPPHNLPHGRETTLSCGNNNEGNLVKVLPLPFKGRTSPDGLSVSHSRRVCNKGKVTNILHAFGQNVFSEGGT